MNLSISMETLDIIITIVLSSIVAIYFGKILPLMLPRLSSLLDRKPFNCRPCTTFHLAWMLTTLAAVAISSVKLFVTGIITAFIIFFIVKYIDNKKVIK